MKSKSYSRILAIVIAFALNLSLSFATIAGPRPDARALASSLPPSDIVVFVDLQRIMMEVIPRLLANDPATLVKLMNTIAEVKAKTGFNILGVDSVVAGVHFVGKATHEMKKENLGVAVIVHGDFDANALIAFLRKEAKGKLPEETYGDKIIYSEPQPAAPRNKKERETAALTVLDANTIAIGDLPQVRATVDAFAGKDRVDPSLVQLAERDASSFIGTAANVPQSLLDEINTKKPPGDPMEQALHKAMMGIKQLFGSTGSTTTEFNVITGARMGSTEQAASLADLLLGVRQAASSQIPDKGVKAVVDSLQITAEGEEIQIRCNIKNEVVQGFLTSMIKNEISGKTTPVKKKRVVRSRRGRRRRH